MDFATKPIPMEAVDAFKGPLQDIVNNTNAFLFGNPSKCLMATGSTLIVGSFGIMLSFFLLYQILRPIARYTLQPRIIVEIVVGLIIGNISFVSKFLNMVSTKSLASLTETGINCYALLLGLSFDVSILAHFPREAIIAYTTIFSTFLVAVTAAPLLHLQTESTMNNEFSFVLAISLTLAGTSSPVLTRLLIEAKFAKSDVGQLVIGAASYTDLVTMILICVALIFQPNSAVKHPKTVTDSLAQFSFILVMACCLYSVMPSLVNWLQKRNPRGKPMRPQDLTLFVCCIWVVIVCVAGITGYSQTMMSFMIGICFPKNGRLMSIMVRRFHEFMRMIVFPLYFCWVGTNASFTKLKEDKDNKEIFVKFFFLHTTMLIAKVLGALACGILFKFHWHISIAIGLFLTVKGHLHIFIATFAVSSEYMGTGSFVVVLLHCVLSISVVPYLAKFIIQRAKMETTYPLMALQWFDPNTELRILVGIHGHQNVQTMINLMEISRGNGFTSVSAYVTDMIQMNDNNTAMFIPDDPEDDNHRGDDEHPSSLPETDANTTMADESVVSMRDQITNMILSYVEQSGRGIKVHRLLAISTFFNMHHDIYNLSKAVQASLIILPYHKNQRKDGKMGNTHHGFRYVNRKVFRHAPCSVGVLVDRGLGKTIERGSSASVALQVAVLFIGGKDDREALAYASQITQHPGVNLTAVRFLQDEEKALSKEKKKAAYAKAMDEKELNLDNEYFANFYEKQVALRKVGYSEKHVESGKEMVSILKSLENQHSFFIVGRGGRGGRVTSFLESGVSDSEESPDLGPIGEILADSDFSTTASVLVIQQHFREELEKDEFKIIPL
ncbi:hypothetical protein MKW98_031225 [Papaver atlanticum]|uniref:Cation/H+ exchanger domain-containing protein n=1 Tax=Papaver atlanticum TaxID=357466 RepID=A0AAD4X507_9MAGN|nr:hypothetical protein MKW98_031225 [Papaver atlanticum]